MNFNDKIAIIILNYNGIDDTLSAVQSVLNQTYQNFHLFLSDNNSKKSDQEKLKECYNNHSKIQLVFFEENLGFTKAHNFIFENYIIGKDFKYFALLNNDAIADKYWLEVLLKRAKKEDIDMVSSKMLNYYSPEIIDNLGHKFLNTGEILPVATKELSSKYNDDFWNIGPSGGAAFYSVDLLKSIGVFDSYFVTGYEDAEFGLRATLAGYRSVFEPKALVIHKMGVSINKQRDYKYNLKIQKDILYTYFKLMPITVIIVNSIFIIPRTIFLLFFFIIFLRFTYLRIFFHAWGSIILKDLNIIYKARKAVKGTRTLSAIEIIKKQEFFLKDNILRFNRIFIKGERIIFEKNSK